MNNRKFKMRKSRRSFDKLVDQAQKRDEEKLESGTHQWKFNEKLRSKTLIKIEQ